MPRQFHLFLGLLVVAAFGCGEPGYEGHSSRQYTDCGTPVDIQEDPSNCGACGVSCGADDYCQLGQCVASRDWATFEVSSSPHELRAEGSVLIDDATGLIWAEPSEPVVDRYGADAFCRQLSFDGRQFRVPTMIQLSTLVDFAGAKALPGDEADMGLPEDSFWFLSVTGRYNKVGDGYLDLSQKVRSRAPAARVRCVALDPTARPMAVHYEESAETFYDTQTHLRWTRETSKPARGGTSFVGPGSGSYDLEDATNYCAEIGVEGFEDWRVPTALELLSLCWVSAPNVPYLAASAVPADDFVQERYFAADPTTGFNASMSWTVDFFVDRWPAQVDFGRRTRCVRGPERQ